VKANMPVHNKKQNLRLKYCYWAYSSIESVQNYLSEKNISNKKKLFYIKITVLIFILIFKKNYWHFTADVFVPERWSPVEHHVAKPDLGLCIATATFGLDFRSN
jgi:hypothetical protein